jgi:hypothetical protein
MLTTRKSLNYRPLASLILTGVIASTSPAGALETPLQPVPPPGPAWSLPEASPTGLEPRATALLKKMSDYVLGLQAFSFTIEGTVDIVAETGQKIQYIGHTEILVRRPDRLWLRRAGPLAQVEGFYDGKTTTLYDTQANYYATRPAPPTLDGLLDMVQDKLGMDLLAADVLYSDLYDGLMRHTVSGFYVGVGVVGGIRAHQLAFRGKDIDWQVWIDAGPRPVPLKYVITRRWYAGAPEAAVELSNWNFEPKSTDDVFVFRPPAGAKRAEFWTPSGPGGKSQ